MMKVKSILTVALSLMLAIGVLVGCDGAKTEKASDAVVESSQISELTDASSSEVAAVENKEINVAGMIYLEDNFMRMLSAGYKKAADEAGANYSEFNCVGDQAAESETIKIYATQGMDGIVIAPLNEASSIEAVKEAAEAGVKVVLCDATLKDGDFLTGGYTSNQIQLGSSTGKAAKTWLEKNGYSAENPCPIAVVCFDSLLPTKSGDRVNGFLTEVGDLVKVAVREDAWEQDKAIETTQNILTAHPEVKMVYGANDGGTIGATMAIQNNGYAGQVVVFGIDASKQMVQLLQDDSNVLQSVTGQDAYAMGYQAMQLMTKTILGEDTGVKKGTTLSVDGILLSREDNAGLEAYLRMWREVVGD